MLEGVAYGGTLNDAAAVARVGGMDSPTFAILESKREHLARFVDSSRDSFRHDVSYPTLAGSRTRW